MPLQIFTLKLMVARAGGEAETVAKAALVLVQGSAYT